MELKQTDRREAGVNVVQLEKIKLTIGYNEILKDLNLSLKSGEIHALLGGKGSGKTPIANIICGNIKADSGKILYYGSENYFFKKKNVNPVIGMIHQNRTANPHFNVWEHLYHDSKDAYRGILLSKRRLRESAVELFDSYGFKIDIHKKVAALTEPDYLILELIRQSQRKPDVLIIDESFSQLAQPHMDLFSSIIASHKKDGVSILFITHNIELLYDFADRITIIRNGKNLFSGLTGSIDKINLIRLSYTETGRTVPSSKDEENFYSFLRFNKAILENLPLSLLVLDVNNTIIMANDFFENQLNLKRVDYHNKHISQFLEWQNDRILNALEESQTNRKMRVLYNVPIKSRERQTINTLKILPIHDGLTALGQIVLIEDVTGYFNLQKKMMLSGNMETIGILAAGVAHEINNSLEIAFNYLRFLSQRLTEPDLNDPVNELKQEMKTIKQVVSKMADFSESSLPQVSSTDLNLLVSNFITLIEKTAEEAKIHFHCHLDKEPVMTKINPNEFREVLTNLVKNSREVLPLGGNIRIKTENIASDKGKKAVLSVEDDGPGIAADMMETVFLPFYSTKKKDSKNVGLGLSLCYSIVDRCGGTIYSENCKPRGCRFTIELPVDHQD